MGNDPLDYAARIKAKGLDNTGVTEAHAKHMAKRLNGHTLLLVEVVHDTLVTHADGRNVVQLAVTSVEPVPAEQEDAVRRLMQALYRRRPEVEGQAVLTGTSGDEQSVEDAAAGVTAAMEDIWDGDTDAPLTGEDVTLCPLPGCALPEGHDGDHDPLTDEPDDTVVQFSGK